MLTILHTTLKPPSTSHSESLAPGVSTDATLPGRDYEWALDVIAR